jgi:hypothetical protein
MFTYSKNATKKIEVERRKIRRDRGYKRTWYNPSHKIVTFYEAAALAEYISQWLDSLFRKRVPTGSTTGRLNNRNDRVEENE